MNSAAETVNIYVDSERFDVPVTLSGAQIKALVQKDLQYQLFLEAKSSVPDQVIADDQSLRLQPDMSFYTVPPAAFGA